MKKIVVIAFLASLSCVYAGSKSQIMVGAELGKIKGEKSGNKTDWFGHASVRAGVETEETRIYVSADNRNGEDSLEDRGTMILALNLEAKTKKYYKFFRAFAGGNIGAINSKNKSIDKEDTDAIGGFQAGALMEVTENITLEAGYKYSWTTADTDSLNPDSTQKYYGALNLKF